MDITLLFYQTDNFCKVFEPEWEKILFSSGQRQRRVENRLSLSEIITIMLSFQISSYRNFKRYYIDYVMQHYQCEFPNLVSYNRFVELSQRASVPLMVYLTTFLGNWQGLGFVDSTSLPVCHNLRIHSHRVFSGIAGRGQTSKGWFYGFKLHLLINDKAELVSINVTPGNVHDIRPIPALVHNLVGKLYGDKGYISKALKKVLADQGLDLITNVRKNMKPVQFSPFDKSMLKKRRYIETVINVLKNSLQIDHTRHRSLWGFINTVFSGLVAYSLNPKKPILAGFQGQNMIQA